MLAQLGSTPSIGYQIDQIDASVAPPRLTTRQPGARARTRSGSVSGTQSPDTSASRSEPGSAPACSTSISSSAGTEFQIVTPSSRSQLSQRSGSRSAPGSGNTSVPPAPSTPKTSHTD